MFRTNQRRSLAAAVTVVAVAVIALIASGVLRPAPVTGAPPSVPPAASPSAPAPSAPTERPDDIGDNEYIVKLDVAPDHDLFVTVEDRIAAIANARTGHANDGMSVAWYDVKIENLGASTLSFTWIGFASHERLIVDAGELDGTFELTLIEVDPPTDIDATGYDRVLILEFGFPVNADDIVFLFQDDRAASS